MHDDRQNWLVFIAAHSPGPFDTTEIREILEQSDLGGDVRSFSTLARTVQLTLAVTEQTEHRAYQRVVPRVMDALRQRWSVERDSAVVALGDAEGRRPLSPIASRPVVDWQHQPSPPATPA